MLSPAPPAPPRLEAAESRVYSRRTKAERSAMNLFQEQGAKDYAAAAAQIPVIDFGPCFAGEPGPLERTAGVGGHACGNVAFFYALNHGVRDRAASPAFAA